MRNGNYKIRQCRICGSSDLYLFLRLGPMPIPNGFVSKQNLKKKEEYYPLDVSVCRTCYLVQLMHTIPAEIMFRNYLYIPSTSTTMVSHFKFMSEELFKDFRLGPKKLVVDIGSNDGTLLTFFKKKNIRVLGIDPAKNLAALSRKKGVPTVNDFMSVKVATAVQKKYGYASVITATNVVAHIHDLHALMMSVSILMNKKSVFVMEFPYLVDLMQKNQFDTIYHEHLSYFSIQPLMYLFKKHKFKLIDIRRDPIHGGSLRVYIAQRGSNFKEHKRVRELLLQEKLKKLGETATYEEFARRVKTIRRDLVGYLRRLSAEGKKIVGYGASAKGNVLLNYCRIDKGLVRYVVDSIHFKQGKYTPGTHLPIYPEKKLLKDMPDYALLMSWNFASEILQKNRKYRERGGQFIITIPYLRIE